MSTSLQQNLQTVQQHIDQYCNPDTLPSQRPDILQRIGSITLEQCIQLMGPYITSTEGSIRSHSYRILYKILTEETEALISGYGDDDASPQRQEQQQQQEQQQERLTALVQRKQTYNSLCRFFADRMQDYEGLVDLLPSVEHLLSHYHTVLDDANVSLLVTQTLQDINTQALKQSTRKTVYDIFDRLMTWYPQLCKVDFLTGFVQCADGERDPINLLQVMRMVPRMVNVAHEESVRMVAEEIFDTVLSPYFPINFKPPANDARRVTPEQLSDALRDAMASTPHFSTYCFTFLLDKITSQITETKVVSLETMAFCVANYGEIYTRPFLVEIWNAIRTEILRSSSPEVIRACLDAIIKIAKTVATTSNITVNMANLEGLIKPALSEIRSPDPKFAAAYSSMLSAAGEASDIVATFIFNATAPHLCHLYHVQQQQQQNDPSSMPVHTRMTSCIALLILARCILEPLAKHSTQSIRPCMINIGKISQFLNSILEDQDLVRGHEELRSELISTMLRLAAFDGAANEGDVFQMIRDGLLDVKENSQVRNNAIKGIAWLHTVGKDDMIISRIAQPLLQTLWQEDQPQLTLEAAIDALAKIGTSCGEHIASDMTEKLFAAIDTPTNSGAMRVKLLETLEKVVEKSGKILAEHAVLRIKRIMTSTIRAGLDDVKLDEKELSFLSRITGRLYRGLPEKDQIELLTTAASSVLHGAIDWTQLSHSAENEPFQPLHSSSHGQFIVPFTSLLVYSLPQSITSLSDTIIDLCRLLVQHVIMDELHTDFTILCVKHALASVVNKITTLDLVMETVVQGMLMSQIDSTSQHSHNIQIRMIETLGWILKGIIMRGAYKWSDVLSRFACRLLLSSDETISTTAAEVFHLVMSDEPNVLDAPATHAKVQVLHKQRFFSVNMNALVQTLQQHRNTKDPSIQQQIKEVSIGPLLLSVAYLVQNVPKTVIVSELERVLPLLLSALTSSDASSKLMLSSLKTTHVLLSSAQDKMCDYLDSIVGPLLTLSTFKDSVAVRIAAVQCLHTLVDYPYHKLFPHQKAIIRGLEPVLDDAKRAVRQEGAKCRNAFFLLSSE